MKDLPKNVRDAVNEKRSRTIEVRNSVLPRFTKTEPIYESSSSNEQTEEESISDNQIEQRLAEASFVNKPKSDRGENIGKSDMISKTDEKKP